MNLNFDLLVKTDAHPSYPRAVNYTGAQHEVVNRSQGFESGNGSTTNEKEILWCHFKQIYKKRNGLNKGKP